MSSNNIYPPGGYALLLKAAESLDNRSSQTFDDEKELILAVLMLLLDQPAARDYFRIHKNSELFDMVEGKLLDNICAVINKTYMMKGDQATIADDVALEMISDYLLAHDEFIFHRNRNLILRKPNVSESKSRKG